MKHHKNYSIFDKEKIVAFIALLAVILVAGIAIGVSVGRSEDAPVNVWVMCKPGSQVNVRLDATKNSSTVGYLDAGDSFLTDGESRNGYIRALGIGEYGEGWVYVGYVVTEEPKEVFQNYVCVAKKRAACRRWIGGPQVDGRAAWLNNMDNVSVFYVADGWACTSRGYIQAEWLEANP